MTLEETFVRSCYYYAVSNPIWYIHYANLVRASESVKIPEDKSKTNVYNPFARQRDTFTPEDMEYFKGEPKPLTILVPGITIEVA